MDSAKNSEKINKKTGEPLLDHLFEPMIKWSKEGGLRGESSKAPNLIFEYESD